MHRGREIKRHELPAAIQAVQAELEANRERLREHDRCCRASGLAAAEKIGLGWPEHLQGLVTLLQYAEHARADLADVDGVLKNVVAVITADGRVSRRELDRLVDACNQLYSVLHRIHADAIAVELDPSVLSQLGIESWSGAIGELDLHPLLPKTSMTGWRSRPVGFTMPSQR